MSFVAAASLMANGRTMSGEQRAAAVRGLLKQFAQQSDLRFKIIPDGSYVMPSVQAPQNRVLPNAGDAYRSPLDVTVKLRPAETYPNLASAIQDVIAQVASASGLSIGVGMMPFNVVLNRKLWFDVPDNISAREALANILHQINADPSAFSAPPDQLAWELNYDPASRGFFFNVVIVPDSAPPRQVSDPAGGVGPTKDRLGQGR